MVVKFASRYSREAHELLSNASPPLAPRLWHCAREPSVNNLFVVVMDYVEHRWHAGEVLRMNTAQIESLRLAVRMLHAAGLVFGDLRGPNVLLVEDRVMLIDFNWAGKEGEAKYPGDILLPLERTEIPPIKWHPQVKRGGLIKQKHDVFMFSKLTGEEWSRC